MSRLSVSIFSFLFFFFFFFFFFCFLCCWAPLLVEAAPLSPPPKKRARKEDPSIKKNTPSTPSRTPPAADKKNLEREGEISATVEKKRQKSEREIIDGEFTHQIHPHFAKFDLTRGGLKHVSIPEVNKVYEELQELKRLFLAARESESDAQIRQIWEETKALVERHAEVCDPIKAETAEADRTSALLRDEINLLNEQLRVAITTPEMVKKSTDLAGRLRRNEDVFTTASTMQHMCTSVGAHLEQLRLETNFAMQSIGSDL